MNLKNEKTICLILGAHRSGSSALSSLVSCLGANLGNKLMEAKADNPKGFWENQSIVDLNDILLAKLGSRWDLPCIDSNESYFKGLINNFRDQAIAIIEEEFDSSKLVSIKDPRLVLLLPFWHEILISLGYKVKLLFLYRHPLEVQNSLLERNGFSKLHSNVLWLESLSALYSYSKENVLFINFAFFYENQVATAVAIRDFLEIKVSDSDLREKVTFFQEKHFDKTLRHSTADSFKSSSTDIDLIYSDLCPLNCKVLNPVQLKSNFEKLNETYPNSKLERSKLIIYLTAIATSGGRKNFELDDFLGSPINRLLFAAYKSATTPQDEANNIISAIDALVRTSDTREQALLKLSDQSRLEIENLKELLLEQFKANTDNSKQNKHEFQQLLDSLISAQEEAAKYKSFYSQYKVEKAAKEWLEVKLAEETSVNSTKQQQIILAENSIEELKAKNLELRGRFGEIVSRIGHLLQLVESTQRWKVGNSIISGLNKLRSINEPFQQFSIANKTLKESKDWLMSRAIRTTQAPKPLITNKPSLDSLKELHTQQLEKKLQHFLKSSERLIFPQPKTPSASIILVLYNRAELTLNCLRSLLDRNSEINFELIVVNNASTDKTSRLLDKLDGIKLIDNNKNLGFLQACNQTLELISAPATLFLNNDTTVAEGSLRNAYDTLFSQPDIGAVGGKITLLDGKLQEAGSIIWSDGSCLGYGRGEDPDNFEYLFERDVDYVSGAFLMTQTKLLRQLKGFDERYVPAYYEDSDLCLSLKDIGFRTVYSPGVSIQHYEFGSAKSSIESVDLMKRNQQKFVKKHKKRLLKHFSPNQNSILKARISPNCHPQLNILYIDDRVPHGYYGSGFPRSNFIANSLSDIGHNVTIMPLNFPFEESIETLYCDISKKTELAIGIGRENFVEFWDDKKYFYDVVWVSRPHNMEFVWPIIKASKDNFVCIYDAEAIFADRQQSLDKIDDQKTNYQTLLKAELKTACDADIIVAVSEQNSNSFSKNLPKTKKVFTCGHAINVRQHRINLSERKDLLFVGNLDSDDSPNVDSLIWFYENAWPLIKSYNKEVRLNVIGSNMAGSLAQILDNDIVFHGRVNSIDEFYDASRVFIAPTRFAAGLPYKIHEAAGFGLPCVATSLLAEQLGWSHDEELKVAATNNGKGFADHCIELLSNDEAWRKIHSNVTTKIRAQHNSEKSRNTLVTILDSCLQNKA